MRKVYLPPKMYVYALACADGILNDVSKSMNDAQDASNNGNPPMDTKGDWSDIWDE